jgi:16S rRNA (adenine1518-N6/adenine1519-N6)-dimethyltransferase
MSALRIPRPRKALGQHWLEDPAAVEQVLEAARLTGDETVVEVGPGQGVLTAQLADRAARVIAVELDEAVLPQLRQATPGRANLEIRQADILELDPAGLPQPYHLVGNLPYYLTSAFFRHFLTSSARPASITVTIQAEVAERIAAVPPRMSRLAVSVQLYGRPEIIARIPRTAFWPVPKVDSAVLRVEDIGRDLETTLGGLSEADFFRMVNAGFAEKRKQLRNSLARNLGQAGVTSEAATALLEQANVDPSRRAETLTVAEWVKLGKAYVG